jgi:hypothetical protein
MSGVRLIPKTDESEFPYQKAKQILLFSLKDMSFQSTDFAPMIVAGERIGWTEEMITAHQALAEGGNCFDFRLQINPYLSGTLYEDNIFFRFVDSEQERECMPLIQELATRLDVRVLTY